jgi:hypothetical protein
MRRELVLSDAHIAEVGFARRTTHPQRRPDYDYERRAPVWDTRHLKGDYSQFGPALALVSRLDDALAVFGPGEEVHLEFDDTLPPISRDRNRAFVLELHGWCKDMDLYTRDGQTVGPLPTRGRATSDTARQQREVLHGRTGDTAPGFDQSGCPNESTSRSFARHDGRSVPSAGSGWAAPPVHWTALH